MIDTQTETLPNQCRLSLGSALPGARRRAEEAAAAFALAQRGMAAGAWGGPLGEEFSRVCNEKQTSAGTAAGDCVDLLETRYGVEPESVPSTDRRARHLW